MISPTGKCATFSSEADGFVRSEGCGAIVLKPLSQALADKDHIAAVVNSIAVNQDGTSANLISPNGPAQQEVIRMAQERAGVLPSDIDFVEAHGTGTELGDALELQSLSAVFANDKTRVEPLVVGALKSRFGNLESACGIASLLKAILTIQKGTVPFNLHCEELGSRIKPLVGGNTGLHLPTASTVPLQQKEKLYAGVSTFGFGGTNAHAIISSAPGAKCDFSSTKLIPWERNRIASKPFFHPLIGKLVSDTDDALKFEGTWTEDIVEFLSHHRIQDQPVCPGTCYVTMADPVAEFVFGGDVDYCVRDVKFTQMLMLDSVKERKIETTYDKHSRLFTVSSRKADNGSNSETHCTLLLLQELKSHHQLEILSELQQKLTEEVEVGNELYSSLGGNQYSGEFAGVQKAWCNERKTEWLGRIASGSSEDFPVAGFLKQVALMDCALHLGFLNSSPEERASTFYLSGIAEVQVVAKHRNQVADCKESWVHMVTEPMESIVLQTNDLISPFVIHGVSKGKFGALRKRKVPALYHDTWKEVGEGATEFMSVDRLKIVPADNLSPWETLSCLDIATRPPTIVIVATDGELASLLRSLRAEHPDWVLKTAIISTENNLPSSIPDEPEMKLCNNDTWFVRRLTQLNITPGRLAVALTERGSLSNISLDTADNQVGEIPADSVRVDVHAVGLNFRDVLNVLDMYPGDPGFPGADFAGRVVEVGREVSRFSVGDNVAGIAFGSLKTRCKTTEHHIVPLPESITSIQASSLPVTATTVHEAFVNLAMLKHGQRVLIHAGTGGVGLIAIQYAKKMGCRIVATAGADFKREYLNKLANDDGSRVVELVTSSRDPEEFRRDMLTFGDVDVVLNSLSGDFIDISATHLVEGGHFCEIGKRNILEVDEFQSRYPKKNYHIIALDTVMEENPIRFQKLLQDSFAFGVDPLPCEVFPFERVVDAFEHLRDAKHIGKVVVSQPPLFHRDGVYIISGGLGYVGRHLGRALVENGAGRIVALSRSHDRLPDDWDESFTPIVERCDVSDVEDVRRLSEKYENVRGVIHAAGVLVDRIAANLTKDDFDKVYAAKVSGARNLINEFQEGSALDFVVLCSSIASGFGSAGQANYGAANGVLDEMAYQGRSEGLPIVSIRWGAWLGGGMASEEALQRTSRMGLLGLEPEVAVNQLLGIIRSGVSCEPVVTVTPLDRNKLPSDPLFSDIRGTTITLKSGDTSEMVTKLQNLDEAVRREVVEDHLKSIAADLGIVEIENTEPWREAGLDSLSMVEYRNLLTSTFGTIKFSDSTLFDYPNISSLTEHILQEIGLTSSGKLATRVLRDSTKQEPFAIVGVSCRFPGGVSSVDSYWDLMMRKVDALSDIPMNRFDWRTFKDQMYVHRGGFVNDVEWFDNTKFGIADVEAAQMDPQQRFSLECALEALTCTSTKDSPDCGVFAACCGSDFATMKGGESNSGPFKATGMANSIVANRISYGLGLTGPSVAIDTACSSSLVALDAAVKALQVGDCSQALVVGVNLLLSQHNFINFCSAKMLSPNGRCATFSDQADGYARGEGCGAIVLKRLSKAKEDGDNILALVHGTAVNQDGRSANLTSPNGPSQQAVIRSALDRAGLKPTDISYVETHGTGTSLGDPQEVESLSKVFGEDAGVILGAVKSNIGHLEGAAGIAGVIKAVLCLQHRMVPPNIHCDVVNPRLEPYLENGSVKLPQHEALALPSRDTVYAGVSSFGFGGTNSHVILSSYGDKLPEESELSLPNVEWNRKRFAWKDYFHPFIGNIHGDDGDHIVFHVKWDDGIVNYLSNHRVRNIPLVESWVSCYFDLVEVNFCFVQHYVFRRTTLR